MASAASVTGSNAAAAEAGCASIRPRGFKDAANADRVIATDNRLARQLRGFLEQVVQRLAVLRYSLGSSCLCGLSQLGVTPVPFRIHVLMPIQRGAQLAAHRETPRRGLLAELAAGAAGALHCRTPLLDLACAAIRTRGGR